MHSQKDNPEKLATKTKKNKAKTQHNIHKNTGALLQSTGDKNRQHRLQRTNKNKTQYVYFCICLRKVMSKMLSYQVSFRSAFHVVMSATISAIKRRSVRLDLQLFVGERMSYLRYLCLFYE
jgi:hypothetical protein